MTITAVTYLLKGELAFRIYFDIKLLFYIFLANSKTFILKPTQYFKVLRLIFLTKSLPFCKVITEIIWFYKKKYKIC